MAEKTTTPPVEAPSAAAPGQGALPAEAAPASAPASSPVPEVAAADKPVEAKTPGPKPEEAKAPEPVPSLLSEAIAKEKTETPPAEAKEPTPKPDEAKPEEVKAEDGKAKPEAPEAVKPPEAAAEQPPAPLPTYEAFKVPEGTQLDETKVKEFTSLLGEFENTSKSPHAEVQALGQKLMDLYHADLARVAERVAQYQHEVWNKLKEKRVNELKSDPRVGGTKLDQSLGNAKYVLESLMGLKPAQQAKLLRKLDLGGVSDDVTFIRGLNNLYERFREPAPIIPNNQSPTPREPGQRGWYDRVDSGQVA